MLKNLKIIPTETTHPLWWLTAIVCSILSIAIIIVGIVVFVGYIVIHPRIPIISVTDAYLNTFQYSQAGDLVTQVTIVVRSQNDNRRAHALYSDLKLKLYFDGMVIANLVAGPYKVNKNDTKDFNYEVTSTPISLTPSQMKDVYTFLKEDDARFDLQGSVRARWRVGLLGSVRFWCHLNCHLHFHPSNGSYIPSRCTSKAK